MLKAQTAAEQVAKSKALKREVAKCANANLPLHRTMRLDERRSTGPQNDEIGDTETNVILDLHCTTTREGSDADICKQLARSGLLFEELQ